MYKTEAMGSQETVMEEEDTGFHYQVVDKLYKVCLLPTINWGKEF